MTARFLRVTEYNEFVFATRCSIIDGLVSDSYD